MPSTHSCLSAFAIIVCLSAFSAVSAFAQNSSNFSGAGANSQNRPTTIYLLRHAESNGNDDSCNATDCSGRLSDKGLHRANLLASWFFERRVLQTLDAVYTSQKYSTYQTVLPTATLADLDITPLPIDSSDLNPLTNECATIDAILNTPAGDTVLVAGDNSTLYNIMGDGNDRCSGLGLLTDDNPGSHRFPKDSNGEVRDYGDVWKVVIRADSARLVYRVNLETTQLTVIDRAR